ncbi:hypothetical protein [Pseudoduganella sp. GCM10020061]|uniref:hypothetical protein n=1 Tax=Pseudoduganella sp. GCM10020061 TaxID=3317345 RepID=UPI0036341FAA
MKSLIIIASLATLAGCATQQPTAYQQPADPREWRTVSVTNVDLPPGAPRPDNYTSRYVESIPAAPPGNSVTYSSAGTVPVYTYGPGGYVPAPVVVAQPYYNQPQVSIGLGFGIGRHGFLGINQHFGGYPYVAPYSYWPSSSFIFSSRHYSGSRFHHGGRHHGGYRRGDGRRGHR